MDIAPPTAHDVLEEILECVSSDADPSWRHGNNMTDVYRRESDGTFWQFCYQRSGDGEWNGLRENAYGVTRVEPYTETVTKYRPVK